MRGKYLTPVQALRVGAKAIRNCFRDQLAAIRQEGLDNIGMFLQLGEVDSRGHALPDVRNRDSVRYGQ